MGIIKNSFNAALESTSKKYGLTKEACKQELLKFLIKRTASALFFILLGAVIVSII